MKYFSPVLGLLAALVAPLVAQDDAPLFEPSLEGPAEPSLETPAAPEPSVIVTGAPIVDPEEPFTQPAVSPDAARRVEAALIERIESAKLRQEEIAVDLSVLTEIEGIEAQLRAARSEAEVAKLDKKIAELEAARDHAALAARSLAALGDQAKIESLFATLKEEAAKAKSEIESYRKGRAQEIALIEAQEPVDMVEPGALEAEARAFINSSMLAWDDQKRSNFLALVYAIATELNVRIPQQLANGTVIQNDFAAALERPETAELQMTLVALAAYRNRQQDSLDGTILGMPVAELVREGAIAIPRGRTYQITESAKNAYLLRQVKAIWPAPAVEIGRWDLGKSQMSAAAFSRLNVGVEKPVPDGDLLALLSGVDGIIDEYRRTDAISGALKQSHTEMLGQAKRHDLRLEGAASAVFQAENLSDRHPRQKEKVAAAARFFSDEAERLQVATATPNAAAIRREAIALNEASIAIGRAEVISNALRQR